ncbi:condensin-2 complex subunit D3 [Tanacetum coccineum]
MGCVEVGFIRVVVEGIWCASAWVGAEETGVEVWGWRVVAGSVESGSKRLGWIGSVMVGSTVLLEGDGRMIGSFVEAIYVLNDCNAHTGQSNFGDSQKENRLFCIRGNDEESKSQRMHIYVSLLKQMAPEQLLATFSKVSSEILVAPCEEMKIPTNKGSSLESSEMEEESAENAVKGRVTQAVKKAQIQNTIAVFIELKCLLERKNNPLTGSLMECLRILLNDYKSKIDEMLVADKQLQKEPTYDGADTLTLSASMNVPKLKSALGYKGNKSAAVLESLRRRQIFDSDDES